MRLFEVRVNGQALPLSARLRRGRGNNTEYRIAEEIMLSFADGVVEIKEVEPPTRKRGNDCEEKDLQHLF